MYLGKINQPAINSLDDKRKYINDIDSIPGDNWFTLIDVFVFIVKIEDEFVFILRNVFVIFNTNRKTSFFFGSQRSVRVDITLLANRRVDPAICTAVASGGEIEIFTFIVWGVANSWWYHMSKTYRIHPGLMFAG